MKTAAGILGSLLLWGTILYVLIETVRMGNRKAPRRRYLIYGGLFLGAPFVGILTAWVASFVFGDSMSVILSVVLVTIAVCWGVAIYLLLGWQRRDHETTRRRAVPAGDDPTAAFVGGVSRRVNLRRRSRS